MSLQLPFILKENIMGDRLVSSHFRFPVLAPRAFADVNVFLRQLWGPLPGIFVTLDCIQMIISSIFIEKDITLSRI